MDHENQGTLMSSTELIRKVISKIFLNIGGFNIWDSIIPRTLK